MSEGYKAKAVMFASLGRGGHMQKHQLVDYPEVTVEAVKESRDHKWVQRAYYNDKEYEKVDAAVADWKKDRQKKAVNMKALSIRQPWAWLIVNGLKPIENRDWPTKERGKFLIHASQGMTKAEFEDCIGLCHEISKAHRFPDGTVLPSFDQLERGGIVGMSEIIDCVSESESPWFFGKYGFVLGRSRPLPFMPMKGRLGFFPAEYDKSLLEGM